MNRTHPNKRRILPVIGITFMCFLGACAWFDKLTHFTIKQSKTVTIPAHVPTNIPYDIYTPFFPTNSEKYFGDNNTNADLIESAKVSSLVATITPGTAEDFSFISSMRIFLVKKDHELTEIAYKNNIPENIGQQVIFDLQDVELTPYIKEDSLAFRLQAYTDRQNVVDVPVKVEAHFLIDAKILGI
jgi:hypothetical protein